MRRASRLIDDADRARIDDAIRAAEANTTGEIVPVLVTACDRYKRAAAFAGVALAVVALWLSWAFGQRIVHPDTGWDEAPYLALGLPVILLIVVGGFFLGRFIALHTGWLLRAFATDTEMLDEVVEAAGDVFADLRVCRTDGATGIVLFASLLERMVVVRGDTAIAAKLDDEQWNGVRDALVNGLRTGSPADGFVQAIERAGALLAEHFPADGDNPNELSDHLHVID